MQLEKREGQRENEIETKFQLHSMTQKIKLYFIDRSIKNYLTGMCGSALSDPYNQDFNTLGKDVKGLSLKKRQF